MYGMDFLLIIAVFWDNAWAQNCYYLIRKIPLSVIYMMKIYFYIFKRNYEIKKQENFAGFFCFFIDRNVRRWYSKCHQRIAGENM